MNKYELFKIGIANKLYTKLDWIISMLAVTAESGDKKEAYYPFYENGSAFFKDTEGEVVLLGDVEKNKPILGINEIFTLEADVIANNKRKIETTYGIALLNQYWIVHAVGDYIPYINGNMSAADIMNRITEGVSNKEISVEAGKKANKSLHWTTGLLQTALPSASEKTMVADPAIAKRRKELVEEHKDDLNNPTVAAKIEEELVGMYREYLKDDPSEVFFKSDSSISIKAKKMHVLQGIEASMKGGSEIEFIDSPLSEQLDVKDLPVLINNFRAGSFSRGAETALGGEIVKFLMRVFQKTVIVEGDCGATKGLMFGLNSLNYKLFSGRYIVGKATNDAGLKDSELKSLVGKEVNLRSPMYCKSKGSNFCSKCMGDAVSTHDQALSSLAVEVGSRLMLAAMKAMHGSTFKLAAYNYEDMIF